MSNSRARKDSRTTIPSTADLPSDHPLTALDSKAAKQYFNQKQSEKPPIDTTSGKSKGPLFSMFKKK